MVDCCCWTRWVEDMLLLLMMVVVGGDELGHTSPDVGLALIHVSVYYFSLHYLHESHIK